MKNTSFFIRHFIALLPAIFLLVISCNKDDDNKPTTTYTISGTASGAQENPPNTSTGTATLTGTYDASTNMLQYTVTYSGLSVAQPTAAHFHGPADVGVNAGVLVPIAVTASPLTGTATLVDSVETHLLNGKLYFNLHTPTKPGGEIRGQVTATPN
jgi:hypothetical protein